MIRKRNIYKFYIALLLCILQVAGIDMYAQQPADSLAVSISRADSLWVEEPLSRADSIVSDSIGALNQQTLAELDSITNPEIAILSADTVIPVADVPQQVWLPNPTKATWLAVVFPGGGQIYNRKYWKLPIFYGGFAGCAYALSWNNKTFKDYSQAYVDIMDGNPQTNSYYNLLPLNTVIDEKNPDANIVNRIKRGKDRFRRYRDLSVFAFIGVYLLSIVDAYVDAELSNFDITPDLSMRVEPTIINERRNYIGNTNNAVGLQCSFTF